MNIYVILICNKDVNFGFGSKQQLFTRLIRQTNFPNDCSEN